jgi:hypothetical protein
MKETSAAGRLMAASESTLRSSLMCGGIANKISSTERKENRKVHCSIHASTGATNMPQSSEMPSVDAATATPATTAIHVVPFRVRFVGSHMERTTLNQRPYRIDSSASIHSPTTDVHVAVISLVGKGRTVNIAPRQTRTGLVGCTPRTRSPSPPPPERIDAGGGTP